MSSFGVHYCAMNRRYELKRRAERQAETRRRIVEAAVELHTSVGPAHTTVSAIAARAGVERHTVYAHFPDERALFDACSSHWRTLHPFPDATRWNAYDDGVEQLRAALMDVYEWYELVEMDLAVLDRDRTVHALTGELNNSVCIRSRASRMHWRAAGRGARRCGPRSAMRSSSRPGARSRVGRGSRVGRRSIRCSTSCRPSERRRSSLG